MWKKIKEVVDGLYAIVFMIMTIPYWIYMVAKRFKKDFGVNICSKEAYMIIRRMLIDDDQWFEKTCKNILDL